MSAIGLGMGRLESRRIGGNSGSLGVGCACDMYESIDSMFSTYTLFDCEREKYDSAYDRSDRERKP